MIFQKNGGCSSFLLPNDSSPVLWLNHFDPPPIFCWTPKQSPPPSLDRLALGSCALKEAERIGSEVGIRLRPGTWCKKKVVGEVAGKPVGFMVDICHMSHNIYIYILYSCIMGILNQLIISSYLPLWLKIRSPREDATKSVAIFDPYRVPPVISWFINPIN